MFDGYESVLMALPCGTDQGCPLSGIVFQFYNADLLDVPREIDEHGVAFVDDTAYLAGARTPAHSVRKLEGMMHREDGAFAWTKTHMCEFALDKFALTEEAQHHEAVDIGPSRRRK
ncbi:hypothetical protein FA95DRAFT_1612370 [Auriscalpium vulgare]|uniref:Uncharacterized protein n=1 Tax=Auriscalpium vulgare TaxID=40419 RepID=A0ACB8R800_9AGAM|nr:hypothetical protein FA95DRAFT_1612370 [Auriscalpium vulgare]